MRALDDFEILAVSGGDRWGYENPDGSGDDEDHYRGGAGLSGISPSGGVGSRSPEPGLGQIFPSPITTFGPLLIWGAVSIYQGASSTFGNFLSEGYRFFDRGIRPNQP